MKELPQIESILEQCRKLTREADRRENHQRLVAELQRYQERQGMPAPRKRKG